MPTIVDQHRVFRLRSGRCAVPPIALLTALGLGSALGGCRPAVEARAVEATGSAPVAPVTVVTASAPASTSSAAPPAAMSAAMSAAPAPSVSVDGGRTGGDRSPTGTPVTIAFGGDVHFEGGARQRLAADPHSALGPIASTLRQADLAMVNLETAVTTRGTPAGKTYVFRAPTSAFTALRSAGIDVATLANNHGMDYGTVGLHDTLDGARAAGFPIVGIGEDDAQAYAPMRTTVKGQRIAVIGATQVLDDELAEQWSAGPAKPGLASAKNVPRLLDAVRAARGDSDTVIVYVHWGLERHACPTEAQRSLVPELVAAGADVVVGSHAHVLLGGGWQADGAYVHYGLGNFVFYSSGNGPNTASGVLTLTVAGRAVTAAQWSPARIVGGVPQPLTGKASAAARSDWDRLRGCTDLAATASHHTYASRPN